MPCSQGPGVARASHALIAANSSGVTSNDLPCGSPRTRERPGIPAPRSQRLLSLGTLVGHGWSRLLLRPARVCCASVRGRMRPARPGSATHPGCTGRLRAGDRTPARRKAAAGWNARRPIFPQREAFPSIARRNQHAEGLRAPLPQLMVTRGEVLNQGPAVRLRPFLVLRGRWPIRRRVHRHARRTRAHRAGDLPTYQ
jgi:hypothetical protein